MSNNRWNPDEMPTKYYAVNLGAVVVAIIVFAIAAKLMMAVAGG